MRPDQHRARPGEPDTPLGAALAAYLAGDQIPAEHLPADLRALVLEIGPVLAALRPPAAISDAPMEEATPSLAEDPLAVALGLVVDPGRLLAAHPLGVARRRRGLKVSELTRRLVARGWDLTTAQVAEWERGDSPQPPALVAAIADILGTTPATLTSNRSSPRANAWQRLLDDEAVAARLTAWADDAGLPVADVRRKVDFALAGAFHRNEREPTAPALLRIIDILRRTEGFLDRP